MSVSIASHPGTGSGNEWLGRLCLKYVNRVQHHAAGDFVEMWAQLPVNDAGWRPAPDLVIKTMGRAGGIPVLIRLFNEAYVGAPDYRRAGWVEALALQTVKGYDPSLIYVGFKDDCPVGFCMSRKCGQTARITGIGVRPACRGGGFATTLLRHAMNGLCERGATEVRIEANMNDVASRRLYTRMGFGPR